RRRRSVAVCFVKWPPISLALPQPPSVPPSCCSDSPTKDRRRRVDLLGRSSAIVRKSPSINLFVATPSIAKSLLLLRRRFRAASVDRPCPFLNRHPSFLPRVDLPFRFRLASQGTDFKRSCSLGGSVVFCRAACHPPLDAPPFAHLHRLSSVSAFGSLCFTVLRIILVSQGSCRCCLPLYGNELVLEFLRFLWF
ncbi:hypothetical protein PIB30_078206, partial [Stylosanthes scabra]|nr:hypothetical protein [Stylosanthes scabra]